MTDRNQSSRSRRFERSFFAKNWPQYELNGLTAREMDGHKVILPIWHNVFPAMHYRFYLLAIDLRLA
jgi:hypothetical protein